MFCKNSARIDVSRLGIFWYWVGLHFTLQFFHLFSSLWIFCYLLHNTR